MRDMARLMATVIIWIGLLALTGAALTSPTGAIANANDAAIVGMMAVMAAAALAVTYAVWHGGFGSQRDTDTLDQARARLKQKRRGRRVEDLIDALDDDEIYELEALLLAQHRDQHTSGEH